MAGVRRMRVRVIRDPACLGDLQVSHGRLSGCCEQVALHHQGGDCAHQPEGREFWLWLAKYHEHRRVALLSGLISEFTVDWRRRPVGSARQG